VGWDKGSLGGKKRGKKLGRQSLTTHTRNSDVCKELGWKKKKIRVNWVLDLLPDPSF